MHMRAALWSIVVGGLIGALLWVGPVGAQPFPGGLPECVRQLNTCNANLQTCQTDLAACLAEPGAVFPGDGVDGPALSYTDNGDGTITDNNTLLMWEKKVAGGGLGTCLTDLHGVDSECSWAEATGAWIAAINAANLGGHNDWRLPNVKELQSIVDYSKAFPGPTVASSFPGVTGADDYWSSTTLVGNSLTARSVNFGDGGVNGDMKINSLRVRAVRGGR
jgi:Protein of unknown function (DUF1566)